MATDHNNDRVLFELRVNDDGSTTVTTSAEWDAYHAGRRKRAHRATPRRQPHDLRAALNSLENIYSELYAAPVG